MSEIYVAPKKIPRYFEMFVIPVEHVDSLTVPATEENGFNEIIPVMGGDNVFRLPVGVYDLDVWTPEQKSILTTLSGGLASGSIQELESDVFVAPAGIGSFDDLTDEQIERCNAIRDGLRPGRIISKRFFSTEMRK